MPGMGFLHGQLSACQLCICQAHTATQTGTLPSHANSQSKVAQGVHHSECLLWDGSRPAHQVTLAPPGTSSTKTNSDKGVAKRHQGTCKQCVHVCVHISISTHGAKVRQGGCCQVCQPKTVRPSKRLVPYNPHTSTATYQWLMPTKLTPGWAADSSTAAHLPVMRAQQQMTVERCFSMSTVSDSVHQVQCQLSHPC